MTKPTAAQLAHHTRVINAKLIHMLSQEQITTLEFAAQRLEAYGPMLEALRDMIRLADNSKASRKNPNLDTRDWQAAVEAARATIALAEKEGE